MCVIVIKKAGQELPNKNILNACKTQNPDGFGYATSSGKYFRTMNYKEFLASLKSNVSVDDACIMHFRWATHGSKKATNCHPFKGYDKNLGDIFFAHNGMLPIASVQDKTDSEICFRNLLLPIINADGYNDDLDAMVSSITHSNGSKFAFVDKNGLHLFGAWTQYDGYIVSNTHFAHYVRTTPRPRIKANTGRMAYASYDNDDFWGWLESKK